MVSHKSIDDQKEPKSTNSKSYHSGNHERKESQISSLNKTNQEMDNLLDGYKDGIKAESKLEIPQEKEGNPLTTEEINDIL
mmetsp:Transcript_18866/g.16706  ORF Transcript_18866/g.16706 Transcript_18866/m.16706 type:complete len:81 (+) Transcript_18866:262-504(+)